MATLHEQLNALTKEADAIIARSKARESLPGDDDRAEELAKLIPEVNAKCKKARESAELMKAIGEAGMATVEMKENGISGFGAPPQGHLSMKGLGRVMAAKMGAYSQRVSPGTKGIVPAGESVIEVPIVNTVPLAGDATLEHAPRLIDVLPVQVRRAPVYRYLRQVSVSDPGAAGVVAPGDVKPTRKLALDTIDARLRVIAVLSEPVDRFLLEDKADLTTWATTQLSDAVADALEDEVLTGDGTGEHFLGLANTPGVQTQAFTTDRLVTLQYGLSKLQGLGISASFIALSAGDWLAIQTTRNTSGGFDVGGPVDPTAQKAWGVPVVVVPGLVAGSGYVVGAESIVISTDNQGVRADWGTPGDTFTRNQLIARVEGRFNLDVMRPHGVVKLALTGA